MDPGILLGLARRSDEVLILAADGEHTAGRLLRRAGAVAARLRDAGLEGGRVLVSLDSGPRFFAALAGTYMAGAIPVLMDPLVREEMGAVMAKAGARAVLRRAAGADRVPGDALDLSPDLGEAEPLALRAIPDAEPILFLSTSGSTGKPALVPKTFAQIDVELDFMERFFGAPRRVATLVPWCHIFGFLTSFALPLSRGGVCDLGAGISPRTVLERARAGRLDLVAAVPAVYQVMVRYLEADGMGPMPASCRFATSGAPLPAALRRRFEELARCRIVDLYGSTEAGGVAFRTDDGPWRVEPHVEMRIAEGGYMEVRSASVSTASPGAFYRMGDLVRPAGEGFVLIGRSDDVVKIGGRRTALGEVEEVVAECPGVARAAVLAEEVHGVLRLVAYVEPEAEAAVGADKVKAFVRSRLADHKVPREVRLVARMPTTGPGKIAREELRAMSSGEE